jgi:hypothetical protein
MTQHRSLEKLTADLQRELDKKRPGDTNGDAPTFAFHFTGKEGRMILNCLKLSVEKAEVPLGDWRGAP